MDRLTDGQTDRQMDRWTDGQTDTKTDSPAYGQTDRKIRQTERQRLTHRQTNKDKQKDRY